MSLAIPSNFANAVAPFVPAGRQPVGQENEELRSSSLRPLEQLPESARRENRRAPDERANEDGERQRLSRSGAEPTGRERELERVREMEEQAEIRELAARDREVRMHEQAHAAIGGRHAGAPRYQYERGPDGVNYAVAGEVPIDTSPVPNDPRATIEKAQQIRRAAFAPLEPSDADRRVAAEAARMEAEARAELREKELRESRPEVDDNSPQSRSVEDVRPDAQGAGRDNESNEEDQAERQQYLQQLRERNLDTYRQLLELGTLRGQPLLGARLDQRT